MGIELKQTKLTKTVNHESTLIDTNPNRAEELARQGRGVVTVAYFYLLLLNAADRAEG